MRTGIAIATILIPVQILVGDLHGLNTLKHQPAKVAAIEAAWHTQRGLPLVLFAWPDAATRSNAYVIELPKMASYILTHELDGEIKGPNEFPNAHPPVAPVFWAFRVMVGMGLLMLAVSWLGAWLLWRKGSLPRLMLWGFTAMTFSGWVATLAGWYVTEIGRQPWIVYGLIRTADVVASHHSATVGATLAGYLLLYALLLIAYVSVVKYLAENPDRAAQPPLPVPPADAS